ncbi:Bystin-domain-containing protein [Ramaria rubella]|nr:Bystin-domain-containing protein [Ramaria rubella]
MPKTPHALSLHEQLSEDGIVECGKLSRGGRWKLNPLQINQSTHDAKTSQRILDLAQEQQNEIEAEEEEEVFEQGVLLAHRSAIVSESNDETDDQMGEEVDEINIEDYELQVDPEARATLDHVASLDLVTGRTLAEIASQLPTQKDLNNLAGGLDPKVVQVYTGVGSLLSRYKSGPLPKAFKIIPSLRQWAHVLALTDPPRWTPNAVRSATRLLVSNLKPEPTPVYLEGVVLPAVREDIQVNGKLNVHLYFALRKAVYKPSAFYKGILLPLLRNHCTLREAAILASIVAKAKIPSDYSSGALNALASMDYSGPRSIFIRTILDKKYTLPYKVLDSVWQHFVSTSATYKGKVHLGESECLPVLWHQSLLVFCERYAVSLSSEQRGKLLDVVKDTYHTQIGPEIRQQLLAADTKPQVAPDGMMEE